MPPIWWIAIACELGLAALALVVGPLVDVHVSDLFWPRERSPQALGSTLLCAVAATMPLLLGLVITLRSRLSVLVELRHFVENEFVPFFTQLTGWGLCGIGFAAGLGEEMLFRGVVQTALMNQFDDAPTLAIGVAAVLFGALHLVTPAYAVLATVAGAYLGWLYFLSGQLVMPILVHGLYDSLALIYFVRKAQQKTVLP
jgi:membrane protease YdiL (CAAX protease family)